MNNFLEQYADLTALIITAIAPLVCTVYLKLKTGKRTRAVPLYLLFFGPCGILAFMFFHLLDNITKAITNALIGNFTYNFHFYSLILLGIVVFSQAYFYLKNCYKKAVGYRSNNKDFFQVTGLIAVTTLPLIPIISIAAIPMICILISLLGFPFVNKRSSGAFIIDQPMEKAISIN